DCILEGRLMNQRAEMSLIRQLKARVMRVKPVDKKLQRPPRVEAGSARIGMNQFFSFGSRLKQLRPLRPKKGEVRVHCPAPIAAFLLELSFSNRAANAFRTSLQRV